MRRFPVERSFSCVHNCGQMLGPIFVVVVVVKRQNQQL